MTVSARGMVHMQAIQLTRQKGALSGMVGAAALLAFIALVAAGGMARSIANESAKITAQQIREAPSLGFTFAQLLLGFSCVVLVTTEWSSGSIMTSIATTQRKSGIVISKALVAAIAAVLSMVLGGAVAVLIANLVLSSVGRSLDLGDPLIQRELIGIVAAGALNSLMAIGLAFLIRRTAPALVTYIAITMVAPIALGMIPLDTMREIASYLPLNASGYMMTTGGVSDSGLTPVEAYVTMGLWAFVCMVAGWWRMTRTN